MSRSKKYTKRRNIRKRRGTRRQRNRRIIRTISQKGGRGMTTSADTNPNEINEEENILERRMRIVD